MCGFQDSVPIINKLLLFGLRTIAVFGKKYLKHWGVFPQNCASDSNHVCSFVGLFRCPCLICTGISGDLGSNHSTGLVLGHEIIHTSIFYP